MSQELKNSPIRYGYVSCIYMWLCVFCPIFLTQSAELQPYGIAQREITALLSILPALCTCWSIGVLFS